MGYSAENYRAAVATIEARRQAALAESEGHFARLHELSPEARELDTALRRIGPELFHAACNGGREGAAFRRVMEENKSLLEAREALLLSLGLPKDYTEVHYTCPLCGDTGYVDIHMCECLQHELRLAAVKSSGLGALLSKQTFRNFSLEYYKDAAETEALMKKTLRLCKNYAAAFSLEAESLLFFGRTGLGKTHLSTAIAGEVITHGYSVVYESAPNVLNDFEFDQFKNTRGQEASRAEKYLSADLLILDDLGTEMSGQFALSALYNLINTRLISGRPTIISTNLGSDELQDRYGNRLASRLMGEYHPVRFVGQDVRMQKLTK